MTYYIERSVDGDFDDVVAHVESALADEDFGILSDIDVAGTMEEKLGVEDFGEYRILGACNPSLAYDAMQEERRLGVLLPCNVVVHEEDGDVGVSVVDPVELLGVVDSDEVAAVAEDVRERLERVLDELPATVEAAD